MIRGAFTATTKRKVVDRQDGGCWLCGRMVVNTIDYSPLAAHEYHHRLPRRAGGRRGEMARVCASPANCLLLCAECHRLAEANRSTAIGYGYIVREGSLPTTQPVYDAGRLTWWLLGTDGGLTPSQAPVPDGEVAA